MLVRRRECSAGPSYARRGSERGPRPECQRWEYAERLFQHNRELTEPDLMAHAQAVGLDVARFRRELQKHTYTKAVEREIDIATRVGVPGVPAVFVNRSRVDNPLDEAALKNAIREARPRP